MTDKASNEGWGIRSLASALANRIGLANAAGISFGGERDLYKALGYKRELTPEDYRTRYDRGEVAGRVVDAKPRATWSDGFEIVDDQQPDVETALEKAWKKMATDLDVVARFQRVDILAGLGQFACLLIGAPGDLDQELGTVTADQVVFLQPFSQVDVTVKSTVSETDDPRFGLPLMYEFQRVGAKSTGAGRSSRSALVHWTRVIHVADNLLDDDVNGQPRLRRVWNRIDDIDKVAGGGAEAFWVRANPPTVVSIDKDLKVTPEDKADLKDQMDELVNNMRRYVAARGLEVQQLSQSVADIQGPVDTLLTLVSVGADTPKRILMGSEQGVLAASQDKDNWDNVVETRRTQVAEPQMVRQFVDRMITHKALPPATEDTYEVRWPNIESLNDKDAAVVAKDWAGINREMGTTVVTEDEIRTRVLGLSPLEEVTDDEADDMIDDNLPEDVDDEDTFPEDEGDDPSMARENIEAMLTG
jgi:hypothetical protein